MFKKLKALSPFELNYQLIKMAGPNALNAGRGNLISIIHLVESILVATNCYCIIVHVLVTYMSIL